MKMSTVNNDFCPFCGFLKQLSTMVKCKSCINNDTELKNQNKLQKCSCEYCLGIGFHVPQEPVDSWTDMSKDNNAIKNQHQKKCVSKRHSKPDTEKECKQLRIEQECCDLSFEWDGPSSVSDWTEEPFFEGWGSPEPNEAKGTQVMEPSDETKQIWMREQNEWKQQLVLEDNTEIIKLKRAINDKDYSNGQFHFGGMDISFVKGDAVKACAALVVLSFPDLKVVYEDYEMVELTEPYIPGFLAFREAGFLIDLYNKLVSFHPQFTPDVIFLDGNGILHPREFGLASHVGVLMHTPCIGVAKNLIHIDGVENDEFKALKRTLKKGGDTMPIKNSSGKTLGMALRSLDSTTNPIYISSGHLVCLETAVLLVQACCKYRIPEPVRQADLNSREFLRKAGFM